MDASSIATPYFPDRICELSWIWVPERLNSGAGNMSITDFFCRNPQYSTTRMVTEEQPRIENEPYPLGGR